MGSLILTMHTSLDGFVATVDGQMWPSFGWPPEAQAVVNDLYRDTSAVVYGRGIFEMVVPFWTAIARKGIPDDMPLGEVDLEFARLMEPLPKYVVSHGLEPAEKAEVISSDVPERVAAIAREVDGHVLLLAGGALAGELAAARVLDELFLVVGPIALGRGRPLLDVASPLPTRLLSAHELAPSCTVMRYAMLDDFPERA